MPSRSDDPLTKTTLNLYTADVTLLRAYFGHGYTEQIRQWVHERTQSLTGYHKLKQTLGDWNDKRTIWTATATCRSTNNFSR